MGVCAGWSLQACRKFGEHLAERALVVGDAEDVVVGPDDRGPAAMAVEPSYENAILLSDDVVPGLTCRVFGTDADQPHANASQVRPRISGQVRRVSLVQDEPPAGSCGDVEQAPSGRRSDPGLRKQRAVRRLQREREQPFLQRGTISWRVTVRG